MPRNQVDDGLSGLQKAAILLIALGPEKSATIFKHLKEDEIEACGKLLEMCTNYILLKGYINYEKDFDSFDWNTDSPDGGSHLNTYGAEKFSEILGRDISKKDFVISDPLSDDIKDEWQKKVNRYENDKLLLMTGDE